MSPWKIVGKQGTQQTLPAPHVSAGISILPGHQYSCMIGEREKAESAVLSAVKEFGLFLLWLSSCSLQGICGSALCPVLPWIYAVGNWSANCGMCFFWASIKSLCLELPTNTGGLMLGMSFWSFSVVHGLCTGMISVLCENSVADT